MPLTVDAFGRCNRCGNHVTSSAGCSPCWLATMSEAASSTLALVESPWVQSTEPRTTLITADHLPIPPKLPLFASLLVEP